MTAAAAIHHFPEPPAATARFSVPMSAEPASDALLSCAVHRAHRPSDGGALVRDAQRGSGEALEELFRRHWRRAHRAAFLVIGDPAAAEDIAQESFLAASGARPLRPQAAVRPVAAPDHRQPGDRLLPGAGAASRERPSAAAEGVAPERDAISDELVAALAGLGPSTGR